MKAFEIHTFQTGRWKIDSVFDDNELAILEARRLNDSGRHLGVRVVEEEFDEQSRRTMARTIFHSSRVADVAQRAEPRLSADPDPAPGPVPELPGRVPMDHGAGDRPMNSNRMTSVVTLVALIAIAVFLGLQSVGPRF